MPLSDEARERAIDYLAELRADPWMNPSWQELEGVLTDDERVAARIEVKRRNLVLAADHAARGITYWAKGETALHEYRDYWNWAVREERLLLTSLDRAFDQIDPDDEGTYLKALNAVGTTLQDRVMCQTKLLQSMRQKVERMYSKLSDRERLFLEKPTPNPHRVDQFPGPGNSVLGLCYPDDPPIRAVLIETLERVINEG